MPSEPAFAASSPTRPRRALAPTPFAIGAVVVSVVAALEFLNPAGAWLLFEDVHLVLAPLVAAVAVWYAARTGDAEYANLRRALVVAMALTCAGQFIRDVPDLLPASAAAASVASDAAYVAGAIVGMSALMRNLFGRLHRDERQVLLLDGLIVMLTAMALVVAAWQASRDLDDANLASSLGGHVARFAIMLFAASFFSSATSAALVALALRVRPGVRGVWAIIAGIVLIAVAWCGWLARFIAGGPDLVEPVDFVFTAGALLLGYGGVTVDLHPDAGPRYDAIATAATEWLPIGAVIGVGGVAIGVRPGGWVEPVSILAWVVVATAMVRQRLTRQRERAASARLTHEIQERAATTVSLARIEAAATPEATADRICGEALHLEGIDTAIVYAFETDAVVVLAARGRAKLGIEPGETVPAAYGRRLRSQGEFGLWIELWRSGDAAPGGRTNGDPETAPRDGWISAGGPAVEAVLPLQWNDEPVGAIAIGTTSPNAEDRVTDRLAALTEFSVVAGAILGPMIVRRREENDLRREIEDVVEAGAFRAVFQPFVDLVSGELVGFEALTRFDDGRRPDLRFADAHEAGMSVELEVACLRRQLADSVHLPPDAFLSLNVSPALAQRPTILLELLDSAERAIVVEITEHVEIADYGELLESLESIRTKARLAVDDAGAGYAGLRHILELRPQFVKLDISVVRSVDTDQPRQAMVAGMAFFASAAGCELIAEGIETEAELETLKKFGVRYGQGYLLGRPAPALSHAMDRPAA